jgi:lipopolysaccharide/colanic/teichoic acid biosynthesis glycosyltransferase
MRHRLLDITLCLLALPVLGPLFALIAVITFLDSPGPVLYRSQRVGLGGRPFLMLKFRSMRHGIAGPSISSATDDRFTPVGRWLRRHRLDELPQVINVLRGDMGLVGPRPELAEFVHAYPDDYERILCVLPGITGPTQLAYADEEQLLAGAPDVAAFYRDHVLPRKIESDLAYVERRGVRGDISVLWRTLMLSLPRVRARTVTAARGGAYSASAAVASPVIVSVVTVALMLTGLFAVNAATA